MPKIKKTAKATPTEPFVKTPVTSTKFIKVPIAAAIFFSLFLVCGAFFLGALVNRMTSNGKPAVKATVTTSKNTLALTQSEKPEFNFFVMSFCPYGNQMEDTLRPVFDQIGNKVEIRPRYIFEKISGNLKDYCKKSSPDPANCDTYVKNSNGQLKNVADCQQQIASMVTSCNDEKQYLKIGDNLYSSLHGRQEANQDVREICAYNLTDDKKKWWNFVDNVNKACTAQNADSCWEEQAKKASLDTAKITDCFNKDAAKLIDEEIALTTKYQVQGSPTLLVNGQQFPPESAYSQDGKGNIAIGKKTFTQDQYRTPNFIKEAVCSAFQKAPKECQKDIADISANNAAPAAGGCAQ